MKVILSTTIIFIMIFISSCIKRGLPIEEQVVYYMENFDAEKYTKYRLSNGDVVYYPNEILQIVDQQELSQFNAIHSVSYTHLTLPTKA